MESPSQPVPSSGSRSGSAPTTAAGLADQIQWTLEWLYPFTMTRLVADQLDYMRKRILSIDRFLAFPQAGYTPEMIADAVEPDPQLRRAIALGLLAPLLENWGLGMTIVRLVQCLNVDGILDRDDAAPILQWLLDDTVVDRPPHPELDLASVRTRIADNLRALQESIRTGTYVHPREVVIDAEPDDNRSCNILMPHSFPTTPSGRAGCRASLSPLMTPRDGGPWPFYERAPVHPAIRWDPLFDRVYKLKKNGPLVGDPGWDDAPPYSKRSKKSGQEKWDWKLMNALQGCVRNFDDFERTVLQSDIGGPTTQMITLSHPEALAKILFKLATALRPGPSSNGAPNPPAFNLGTLFSAGQAAGTSAHFGNLEFPEQRALFLQLYGPMSDFIPSLDTSSSSGTAFSRNKGKATGSYFSTAKGFPEVDGKDGNGITDDGLQDLVAAVPRLDVHQISQEERNALGRAAQRSRDQARAHIGLPALGLLFRNELMCHTRSAASETYNDSLNPRVGNAPAPAKSQDDVAAAAQVLLEGAVQRWIALGAELRREAEAEVLGAALRARANAEARMGKDEAIQDGWARGISNSIDLSTRDGWEPAATTSSGDAESLLPSSVAARLELLEKEAGLVGPGVPLEDPSLELNLAAALLKLTRAHPLIPDDEEAERRATRALELLAQEEALKPPPPPHGDDVLEPLLNQTTGPAEVLDAVAFWIGGGHSAVLQLDDFDAGYYSAGYAFGSSRIARETKRAERRERRKGTAAGAAGLAVVVRTGPEERGTPAEGDDAEPDGDASEEFAWWEEEVDDEPAPGSWNVRSGLKETETEALERVRTSRRATREARAQVLSNLVVLLRTQLLCDVPTPPPEAQWLVDGGVSPGLGKTVLAPSRSRTAQARSTLVWKALVRRAKARMSTIHRLGESMAAQRLEAQSVEKNASAKEAETEEEEAAAEQKKITTAESIAGDPEAAAGHNDTEETEPPAAAPPPASPVVEEKPVNVRALILERRADLARKDLEAALALDPKDKVPREELKALEELLSRYRSQRDETVQPAKTDI
ncbi:hypothetical protein V8E36_008041 [Tilletia maclaganii]